MELLNQHNKHEYAPMHTAEHILNRVMVNKYGCPRSHNAHIERKKSKISFSLPLCPSEEEIKAIADEVNRVISSDMAVTYEFVDRNNIPADVPLDQLPPDASSTLRLVRVGNFDVCACIGLHVAHTAQIGKFILLGTNWNEELHSFRIRFKLDGTAWSES